MFGSIGSFVYLVGVWAAGQHLIHGVVSEATQTLMMLAVFAALLCTFIGNIGSLHK